METNRSEDGSHSEDAGAELELGELGTADEIEQLIEVQRRVWGASERELVPASQLQAIRHAGGLIVGAWLTRQLVGFVVAMPCFRPELRDDVGLHSDMAGVLSEYRGRGIGRALKLHQRRWCLERGVRWVQWTFDPLRPRNARFNLEHLGATAGEFIANAYGAMDDELNRGLPSHRLVATWELTSREVTALASRASFHPHSFHPHSFGRPGERKPKTVLALDGSGWPRLSRHFAPTSEDEWLAVEVPQDGELRTGGRSRALAWSDAVREAFELCFSAGYRASRFDSGRYLLTRSGSSGREK